MDKQYNESYCDNQSLYESQICKYNAEQNIVNPSLNQIIINNLNDGR